MGFFSSLKQHYQESQEQSRIIKARWQVEYDKEAKRPDIKSLIYTKLDPSIADRPELINAKVKLTKKKYKKLFLECIKAGKAEYAEAVMIDSHDITIAHKSHLYDQDINDQEEIKLEYIKVADINGVVRKEIVATMSGGINLPDGYEKPSDMLLPDDANPDMVDVNKYVHCYILHYFLGDKEMYRALSDKQFADLSIIMNCVYLDAKSFYENRRCVWW